MMKRTLILGAAVITSTLLSLALSQGWAVLAGPVLMSVVLVWVTVNAVRQKLIPADRIHAAAATSGGIVIASEIIALVNPFYVAVMLPILAGSVVGIVGARAARRR